MYIYIHTCLIKGHSKPTLARNSGKTLEDECIYYFRNQVQNAENPIATNLKEKQQNKLNFILSHKLHEKGRRLQRFYSCMTVT